MAAEPTGHQGLSNLNPRQSWTHHPDQVSSDEACRLRDARPRLPCPRSGPKAGPAEDSCVASTASVQRHVHGARRTQDPPPGVMTSPADLTADRKITALTG